jgi:hypothetical protein
MCATPCTAGVPWNNYPETQTLIPHATCVLGSLAEVVAIVREAEAAGERVHAFGSRWAFSDCAVTSDRAIDTTHLNRPLQTVQQALRPGQASPVYHCEAGMTIREVYNDLSGQGLALETMGGSSGQTLAGAISTGTHGGDKFLPPLADSVVAIHLVGAGGTQYWIEPAPGVTDPALLRALVVPDVNPANIIYDERLFDACLVSLGCMGVIYAVVMQVREAYGLVETTAETTWSAFKRNISTYLDDPTSRFLQVLVDPYHDGNNDNVCLVTTRSEAVATDPVVRPQGGVEAAVRRMIDDLDGFAKIDLALQGVFDDPGPPPERRLAKIVAGILRYAPDQRHVMIEHYADILRAAWPPGTIQGASYSIMDNGYGQEHPSTQPGYSVELFFPPLSVNRPFSFMDFVDAVIAIINSFGETFFAGYVSLRFTGQTAAFLGMQQWDKTCAAEISAVQGVPSLEDLLGRLYVMALQNGGLAHWGQLVDMGGMRSHGSVFDEYFGWRVAYARMSHNYATRTFENDLSNRWNLTKPSDAKFISQAVPPSMETNQVQPMTVTMMNTGVTTWTQAERYRLVFMPPPETRHMDLPAEVIVPNDVPPDEMTTFEFGGRAPYVPGPYGVQWRMVQGAAEWFGNVTPLSYITVSNPPAVGPVAVPLVLEETPQEAADTLAVADLKAAFFGGNGPDPWVVSQSPRPGTKVSRGSTVRLTLQSGPRP